MRFLSESGATPAELKMAFALLATLVLGLSAGCHKKIPPPPPPAPAPLPENTAPGAKPSISYFTAEPSTVTVGQPSSLRWSVADATSVRIDNAIVLAVCLVVWAPRQ